MYNYLIALAFLHGKLLYTLAGYVGYITPRLLPIYNTTGPLTIKGPAEVAYMCYSNPTHTITVSRYAEVDLVPATSRAWPLIVAIAATGGLVALSYLASQRKKALWRRLSLS
jgi:hypothetical protein